MPIFQIGILRLRALTQNMAGVSSYFMSLPLLLRFGRTVIFVFYYQESHLHQKEVPAGMSTRFLRELPQQWFQGGIFIYQIMQGDSVWILHLLTDFLICLYRSELKSSIMVIALQFFIILLGFALCILIQYWFWYSRATLFKNIQLIIGYHSFEDSEFPLPPNAICLKFYCICD